MSTLLRAKRALERQAGTVFFDHEEDRIQVLRYAFDPETDEYTREWLGSGETHEDAIENAHQTLRVRAKSDAAECAGDYKRELRRDGEL